MILEFLPAVGITITIKNPGIHFLLASIVSLKTAQQMKKILPLRPQRETNLPGKFSRAEIAETGEGGSGTHELKDVIHSLPFVPFVAINMSQ